MFFKCLLNVFWTLLLRDVFRNPIKSLWWSIFAKMVEYFCKDGGAFLQR